ncbi:hypothetical protein DFP72DRAFT_414528 [Ephemerocybe angulata]|uniref:Uncharacterized protein n=1 Tax=Ephemerocybe angulata TaxID=980116 RepID=A0A8H6IGV5_9AGAR|nr:hypothetical protein DFP72DRAFT_414528 [Tulosesus angulatus]
MDSAPVSPERNTDFPASALVCPEDRQNIDELWKAFDEFYTENKGYIENAQSQNEMVPDIAPSKKSMQQEALKMSLLQNSRIILRGLQVLGQIHPAISVVITAFDAVIAIELNRRDNNAKAASVMTQMQNFMCALFQLRSLKSQELHPVASEELVKFMTRASEDIKACGSDIDYYLKKRLISRLVHAQFFQQRLAEHIATFAERRSELTLWLTGYTTGRVNEHIKITVRLEDKVDRIAEILHRYDSPQEKEALRFITEHAGFSNCLDPKNPRLFAELLERTGSVSEEEDSDEAKKQAKDNLRDQLLRELKEDIKDILSKNLPNFEALIRIQQNNFDHFAHLIQNQTSTIVKMSNHIMLAFPEGRKYVLITDPLLKKIWMEMGLRQSVKAEKFVLTFKDYYSREQSAQSPFLLVAPDSPVVALSAGSASLDRGFSRPITDSQVVTLGIDLSRDSAEDEQWALNYIDVVHLDPIVEAIDDDFSGFISILEANQFAIARPRSWSLLRWLAYWAAGWAVSIKKYKEKILQLVRQIYDSRQDVMACNMSYVDEYLDGYSFQSLDTLLRSTQPSVGESEETDAKLAAMVSDLDDGLEQRLLANLKSIKFNITSVDTVALITGPGRIERFVFPLIYLLLRHHLRIVKVASQRRLSTNYKMLYKMRYPSHSLQMVFEALRTRTAKLNAIFRRKPQDVQELFKKFSFGMMELFNSPKPYERKDSALLAPLLDASGYSNTMDDDAEALKIISEQLDHDGPDLEDEPDCVGQAVINDFSSTPLGTQSLCPTIGGAWTGLMRRPSSEDVLDESANDLVVFRFDTPSQEGSELTGEAESFLYGGVLVQGNVERKERPAMPGGEDASEEETSGVDIVALDFKVLHEEEPVYHFRVAPVGGHTFDWEGTWCYARPVDDQQAMPLQFKLTRSPPEAFPYRHILKLVTKEEGPVVEDATPADTNDQPALISVPATLVPTDDAVEIIALSTDAPTPFVEQPTEASDITPTPAVRPLTDGTVELQIEDPGSSVQPPKREIRTIPQARWAFAIEVVRYQVRQRLHSKSHYAEMAIRFTPTSLTSGRG